MLEHIRLVDFKSFVDEQVALAPFTVLVGINASGKSNLLDAIRFLSRLPKGESVREILDGTGQARDEHWTGMRGRVTEAARLGSSRFELHTTWAFDSARIQHMLRCRTAPDVAIEAETVTPSPTIPAAAQLAAITRVFTLSLLSVRDPEQEFGPLTAELCVRLGRIKLLGPRPELMREFGRRGHPLGPNGENLSGVLADLCADPNERRNLVDWLAELCAPELTDLDFIEVPEHPALR